MVALVAFTILVSKPLVLMIEGITPGKTEMPQLEKRFGKAARSIGGHPGSVHTWHLKEGLTLQADGFDYGKEGLVVGSISIVSWKGSLGSSLAKNGLKTQIKPLESLYRKAKESSVSKALGLTLGKAPRQRYTFHHKIDLAGRSVPVFVRFGWSQDNRLLAIDQRDHLK